MEGMEYYENHQAEFEAMEMATEEVKEDLRLNETEEIVFSSNDCDAVEEKVYEDESFIEEKVYEGEPLEDHNWALIYGVRDQIETFTDEMKGTLKSILEDACGEDTAKSRLYSEAATLYNNVMKLEGFLRRRNSDGVLLTKAMRFTDAQVLLMQKQAVLMRELYNVLAARISIFDVRANGEDVEIVKE